MGSYYSFNQNKNILFDIGARQINLSRIKYIKSKETLLIYINAQISTAQNAMFIFTLTYPSSQYQNAGQLLNPMFEIPQSNITIIEPCLSNYSDMVLLYTDSEILILKSDNFQNQIKQHALFNDGGNLFKKFCFTSNDSKIICASYSGYISIYDINQGKKNEIINQHLVSDQSLLLTDICNIDHDMFQNCFCISNESGDLSIYDYNKCIKISNITGEKNKTRANKELFDNLSYNQINYNLSMNIKDTCTTVLYDLRKYDKELCRINFGKRGSIVSQKWNNYYENCLETMFLNRKEIQISKVEGEGKIDLSEIICNEEINDFIYYYESNGPFGIIQYEKMFEIYSMNENIYFSS